jgi:PelA/Pel-15E family pectate lyase
VEELILFPNFIQIFAMNKRLLLVSFFALNYCISFSQKDQPEFYIIDTAIFSDGAHHWYDLYEKTNIIQPKKNQPRYKATQIAEVADNILLYQRDNGGWPKNYDPRAILTTDQKDSLINTKNILHTTIDNNATYAQIQCLAKVYYVTKTEKYKTAALRGFDYLLSAQYDNGGWPQYFPLEKGYSRHITFNDDAMTGVMWMLKDVVDKKVQYDFLNDEYRKKIETAFNKGIDCILKTQINDAGKPTAWCQQYDEVTLQPAWARAFEPPSICNRESVEIVKLLMNIKNPSKEIIAAVDNAVVWFNESKILNTKVETITASDLKTPFRVSKHDKVVVKDENAPPIWTRYYELKTHRPLFCNRDSKVVYSLAEVERERRDGYGWYTYEPKKVLDKYKSWKDKLPAL